MPHTVLDLAVVAIVLISAVLAFIRGFTREVLSLGTWLLASYLAFTQYTRVTPFLTEKISNEMVRSVTAGVIVFALVMLVLVPIGFYLRGFIKGEQVTAVDRSLGFVFGAARGYVLMAVLYMIVAMVLPEEKQPDWLKDANTRPALAYGADIMKNAIPAEQRALLEKKSKDAEEKAEGKKDKNTVPLADPATPSLDNKLDQLNSMIQNATGQGK